MERASEEERNEMKMGDEEKGDEMRKINKEEREGGK